MLTLKKSLLSMAVFLMMVCLPTSAFADDFCPLCQDAPGNTGGNGMPDNFRYEEDGDSYQSYGSVYNNNYDNSSYNNNNNYNNNYDNSSYNNDSYNNSSYNNSSNESFVREDKEKFIIGLGLRGIGVYQTPIKLKFHPEIDLNVQWGGGYYIKGRVNRFIGIDFENDFMYGSYKNESGSFLKVTAALGLQGHFLDYGHFNLYAGIYAAFNGFFLLDGGNVDMGGKQFSTWSGQFGLGFSYITHARVAGEFALDVRYVIEQAPDDSAFGMVDQKTNIHGLMISLSVGLAL